MGVMGTLLGGKRSSSSANSSVSAAGAGADTTGSNSNSERQPPSPESDSNSSAPNAAAAMAAVSLSGDADRPDAAAPGGSSEYSDGPRVIGFSGAAHHEQEAAAASTSPNRPIRPQPDRLHHQHHHHHHHRSHRSRVSRQQQLQQQGALDRDEMMLGEPVSRPAPQSTPTRQRLPAVAPVVPVMARNDSGSAAAAVSQHQSSQQSQQTQTQTSHISPAAQSNIHANSVDGRAYASASPSAQASPINTAATSAAAALAALPPPGLSGPASFRFSPACPTLDGSSYVPFDPESKEGSVGGRYLSFLSASGGGGTSSSSSSSDMVAKMIASQPRNVHPPLKSAMASNNEAQQQQQQQQQATLAAGSAATATERKLCVIDLEPFTRQLRREEEEYYASRFGFKIGKGRDEEKQLLVENSKAANHDYYDDDDDHMEEDNEDAERAARQGEVVVDFAKQGEFVVDFAKQRAIENSSGSQAGCASTPTPLLPISDPRIISQQYAEPLLNLTFSAPVMPPCRPLSPEKLGMRNSFDKSGQRNGSSSNKTVHERPTLATEHAHRHKRREHLASRSAAAMSLQEGGSDHSLSLAERLRRERQRLHSSGVTQFGWSRRVSDHDEETVRIIVPHRGNIYVQDGIGPDAEGGLRILYDKSTLQKAAEQKSSRRRRRDSEEYAAAAAAHAKDFGAIDPQLSPDGTMVAFVVAGEIYVVGCEVDQTASSYCSSRSKGEGGTSKMDIDTPITSAGNGDEVFSPMVPLRITFGAVVGEDDEEEGHDDGFSSGEFQEEGYISDTGTDELSDTEIYNVGVGESLGQASRMQRHAKGCRQRKVPIGKEKRRYPRSITHGLADFVAQEEMDRYRGFWWDPSSSGIVFARVDESDIPPFRITHQGKEGSASSDAPYEDHRYPFAGEANPVVRLGYVKVDRSYVPGGESSPVTNDGPSMDDGNVSGDGRSEMFSRQMLAKARANWNATRWFDPPSLASEYLARVNWLPDGTVCAQWQDRNQALLLLVRLDLITGKSSILHKEYSDVWINLHHMMRVLPRAIHPDEVGGEIAESKNRNIPKQLPEGSFSFLFASERTGYSHLYLYTHVAGTEKYVSTTDDDNSDDDGMLEPEIDTSAILLRAVSAGPWIVESIVGVDTTNDVVYITGTYDSPLQRHLYALPLLGKVAARQDKASETEPSGVGRWRKHVQFRRSRSDDVVVSTEEMVSPAEEKADAAFILAGIPGPKPPDPIKLTSGSGMHSVVMDKACRLVVDTCSDLDTPTRTCVYALPVGGPFASPSETEIESGKKSKNDFVMQSSSHPSQLQAMRLLFVCYEAKADDKMQLIPTKLASIVNRGGLGMSGLYPSLSAPEILSFPTSDGTETLYAALYKPDPMLFGPGPYPLVCAVYGGPHVQRVNRSWSQSADMRAQHLRSLGFAVVKCDNRGSSRRGVAFEGAIRKRLGRLEVLDQVAAVRHLVQLGIADGTRVGIYGWSYGGYLSTMCLVRAPDVFHVAVAGAPVTSWDGYDTHYTERYMGLPSENESGYNESAIFDHVPNMRGKLMIVHGLIDENVHFRHTARLINRLIAAGKEYELLIFPDERHSPRRLRDRVYMEKRISDYLVKNLLSPPAGGGGGVMRVVGGVGGLAGIGASGGVAPKL